MILNRQRTVRVGRASLDLFLRRVCRHLGLGEAEATVCLVSDAEIARMNEAFRKKKGPTDVLSFPAVWRPKPVCVAPRLRQAHHESTTGVMRKGSLKDRRSGSDIGDVKFLGDIAIAPAVALRNARKYGRSLPAELQILILHGVLHLLGYDHESDRGEMNRLERRLRQRFGLA
jgi:probable rRNA maturation factor